MSFMRWNLRVHLPLSFFRVHFFEENESVQGPVGGVKVAKTIVMPFGHVTPRAGQQCVKPASCFWQ